jgi:hypothetical protein
VEDRKASKYHPYFNYHSICLTKLFSQLYQTLVKCNNPSVKQTLAASLHEIAKILENPSLVEEELLPVFEQFIQVTLLCSYSLPTLGWAHRIIHLQDAEDVQMGVLKHLAEFLKMLSVPCRLSFLPMLQDILNSTNPYNWRLRQSLAAQLPDLIDLPPVENLYSSLYPLVTSLLQDSIVSVRRSSYKGVAKLINVLAAEAERETKAAAESGRPSISEAQLEDVASIINMLAHGDSYNMRLVWVELCHTLLRELPPALFEKYFVEGILLLTSDKTTNIRIAIAALLAGWGEGELAPWDAPKTEDTTADGVTSPSSSSSVGSLCAVPLRPSPWTWLLARYDIQQCVLRLAKDDRDVVVHVRKLQPMFPEIRFSEISCRGYVSPPGGSSPVTFCAYSSEGKNRLVINYIAAASSGDALDEGDNESVEAHCADRTSSISSNSQPDGEIDNEESVNLLHEQDPVDSDIPAIDLEKDIILGNLEEQELFRGKERVFTGHEDQEEDEDGDLKPGIKPSHATMRFDEIVQSET